MVATIILFETVVWKMPLHGFPSAVLFSAKHNREEKTLKYCTFLVFVDGLFISP